MQLKSSYYIQEFNQLLARVTGEDVLLAFQKTVEGFSVNGLPEQDAFTDVNPLLKVAWNIVSRGERTLASLFLAERILTRQLGAESVQKAAVSGEVSFNISSVELEGLEKDDLIYLLTNFNEIDEGTVASKLGSGYLMVYRVLRDLQLSAQFQATVLLAILSKKLDVESGQAIELLDDEELGKIVVEDLNELFQQLNALVDETEEPLNLISERNVESKELLVVGYFEDASLELSEKVEKELEFYTKVLTDRTISYKPLGIVVEYETSDGKDGKKYAQRFDFNSESQQVAITYFLQNIFRKEAFRPGQLGIINRAVQTQDVIGLLPTGGGKSLTYQICAILQPGVTVVVDPINSLMKDQFDKLIEYGFSKVQFINSFNTPEERDENLENLTLGKYQIVFVSPERFQIEKFRSSLHGCSTNGVYYSYAVIDEAHCVSEWGHDFRHTYLNLSKNIKRFCPGKSKHVSLFGLTATASFDVLADVQRELEMKEDAIITLPAEAVDRKELKFEIIPTVNDVPPELMFYERERRLSEVKYPLIRQYVKSVSEKVAGFEGRPEFADSFFESTDGLYQNAGIIFCPTKSDRLKSGVIPIRESIIKWYPSEAVGTFFGSADDDTIVSEYVSELASESRKNQDDFINNRTNLMISTKAFGMGIDKPNIRYTLHYTFPNSVESFYQEAGRAGRDRVAAICGILYSDVDRRSNLDFLENSFRGVDREKAIMDELLDEVQYEDYFNLNVLKRKVQDKFPALHSMGYGNVNKDGKRNERYIYLNGPWKEQQSKWIKIGLIDLERNLRSYDNATQNFDIQEAEKILDFTRELIRKECPDGDFKSWLKQTSAPGIKTQLNEGKSQAHVLRIGFTNRVLTEMKELVDSAGIEEFEEKIIRAAYNFSKDEEGFIERLRYQYENYHNWSKRLVLSADIERKLTELYPRIRNAADTQRAIYRMTIAGIIDDYTIDYAGKFLEVKFQPKEDKEYINSLRSYFKRYLGDKQTNNQIAKVRRKKADSILNKTLYTLLEFIDSEIGEKRRRSIEYMASLCELGINHGDKVFRENIVYYFTSKYARMDYLPKDTDEGRVANAHVVRKYLDFISKPPDGLGGEIDNAKHLRGACSSLRINMRGENASIDLLSSFSSFALDVNNTDADSSQESLRQEAIDLYRKGFKRLSETETWENVRELQHEFNSKVIDLNPSVKSDLDSLTNEIMVNRTSTKLSAFLKHQLVT